VFEGISRRTSRLLVFLCGAVVAVILLLFFVVWRSRYTSSGPKPQAERKIAELKPNIARVRLEPEPRGVPKPKESRAKKEKRPVPVRKRTRRPTFLKLRIKGRITCGGKPAARAHLVEVRCLKRGPDGFMARGFPFSTSDRDAVSDDNGEVAAVFFLPTDTTDDSPVAISAYHPEYGSYYGEFTFGELKKLGKKPIHMELEARTIVEGRLVDAQGKPASGVQVKLGTMWPAGGVSMEGVSTTTNEEGRYKLAGIGFDNEIRALRIIYLSSEGPRVLSKTLQASALERDGDTIRISDIVLPEDLREQ